MAIIRQKRKERFSIVDNKVIEDERLSFKARGLLIYMLSKPDDWKFYTEELAKRSNKDGISAIKTALNEIEDAGYLTRKQGHKKNGQFTSQDWILTDTSTTSPQAEKPLADKASAGKALADNRTLPNTDFKPNTDHTNKDDDDQNEQTVCSKWTDGSAQNEQANTRYYTDITSDKNDDDQPTEDAFNLAQLVGINVNSGLNLPIFTDYIKRLGNDLVCYAIKRTNELASHPNWSYLKTVLKSLEDNHVKTIEQAEALSKKYGKQRYKGSKQKTKSTPAYQLPTKDEGMTQAEALAKELAKEEEEDRKKSGDS